MATCLLMLLLRGDQGAHVIAIEPHEPGPSRVGRALALVAQMLADGVPVIDAPKSFQD